jgi:hypothetical protein
MITAKQHRDTAIACMELITEHKDDEAFDKISGQTLAQCAIAEALLGILQALIDDRYMG